MDSNPYKIPTNHEELIPGRLRVFRESGAGLFKTLQAEPVEHSGQAGSKPNLVFGVDHGGLANLTDAL